MLYLKKITNQEGETLNLIEAKIAIDDGKRLSVALAENTHSCSVKTSFGVKDVVGITEAEGCFIIKTADGEVYPTAGWDDNSREIRVQCFMDYTDKVRVYNMDKAREAVALKHDIRALSHEIQTGIITKFLEDDLFETCSGSQYRIV